jgi:Zn-dependent metalloprotease
MDLEEQVTGYELAWLVQTRMVAGGTHPYFYDTVVSANDGRVIKQWNMLKTVVGTGYSQYNGSVPINTTLAGSTYSMKDPGRGVGGTFGGMAITNANHTTSAGSIYTNSTNTWGDGLQYIAGGSTTNANGQTAAVNAMWGLMNTYDMLKNTLGWLSLDGHNTSTYIAAHVNTAYDNAYYSDTCKCMFIGDGSFFNSLGSIDVIGHEMGHGVTAATSNLIYAGESGGLNESSSDISGDIVEAYARAGGSGDSVPDSGNDWMLGKEISKNATPLRYMYKPSKDGYSPDAWSISLRFLDVHYSSGPNNRMFYFLAQGSNADKATDYFSKYLVKKPLAMTGIGTDKAFRIWFKADDEIHCRINYADARNKVLAAQELYGMTARKRSPQRAYAAINVGPPASSWAGPAVAGAARPSRIRIDRRALPPFLLRRQFDHREMQVRRVGVGIAGDPDIADQLAALEHAAFLDAVRIAIEVGIVIGILFGRVELVDGQPARLAVEQLDDLAVGYRDDLGAGRRHDVERFMMAFLAARLVEIVRQLGQLYAVHRNHQLARGCRASAAGDVGRQRHFLLARTQRQVHFGQVGGHDRRRRQRAGQQVGARRGRRSRGRRHRHGGGVLGNLAQVDEQAAGAEQYAGQEGQKPSHENLLVVLFNCGANAPFQFCSTTPVPPPTELASAAASQLVRRMQPCDWVLPIEAGTGVP